MIQEHDQIVLTADIEGTPFVEGDVGTVVYINESTQHVEVEFFALTGDTLDVVTVPKAHIREPRSNEVIHARSIA